MACESMEMRKILPIIFIFASVSTAQVSIGTGVQLGGGGSSNPLDVTQYANSGEAISTYQERIFVPASTTTTLADIKGVSGTVLGWTIGACSGTPTLCSGTSDVYTTVLKFSTDGNVTPDMTLGANQLGSSWEVSNTYFAAQRLTTSVSSSSTGQFSNYFYYPSYFSTEWKMTATTNSGQTNGVSFWVTVWYTTSYTSPLRLKASAATGSTVNLATTPLTLLNIGSGSGFLAGVVISTSAASNKTYNEVNVQTYLDGSSTIGQALPASGSSGTGCSVGDTFAVVQGGASGGQVMATAVSSGAVISLIPVAGHLGTGYTTAGSLSTTAVSSTCSVTPTVYVSTAQLSNDSIESYMNQSLEFGISVTRQAPLGFVSAYASSGNTNGWTTFIDLLGAQRGNRFTNGVKLNLEADPIKAAVITTSVTIDYAVLYYQ